MTVRVFPSNYQGEISIPASKSYIQRAIAISIFADKQSIITGYTHCNDNQSAISIAEQLGAKIEIRENSLHINPINKIKLKSNIINCGEAGLSCRMFTPIIAALTAERLKIDGEGSLPKRSMKTLIDTLKNMGKIVHSRNDFLPFEIEGKITNYHLQIDGSETSQILTGLLIVLPLLDNNSTIKVNNLKSIPYVQMTLDILSHFNIKITHKNYEFFEIEGGQKPSACVYDAEGDWSGAAFHIVAAAISGKAIIKNLNLNSSQADRKIIEIVRNVGAKVNLLDKSTILVEKDKLEAFKVDATHCPDLFPPLAALAASCNGTSEIIGIERLKNKESNRALSIKSELEKLGVSVVLKDNSMFVSKSTINGGVVNSNNDHRIAMACAVLGLVANTPIIIENAEAINKSYPEFFYDYKKLNGYYELVS